MRIKEFSTIELLENCKIFIQKHLLTNTEVKNSYNGYYIYMHAPSKWK